MPSPAPALVRARSLRKRYGRSLALDDLHLEVRAGEIHGFLGPNGAGKSTTIRILLGLVRATGGSVEVLGRDPWRDPVATNRDVAYVPGDVALWPNLTGGEAIDLLLSLRGGADPGERARLLDAFELDPRKRARTYSRATGRRSRSSRPSRAARRCTSSTSRRAASTRSWRRCSARRCAACAPRARPCCSRATC